MEYLSGFRSEMYQLDLARAFELARNTMSAAIQPLENRSGNPPRGYPCRCRRPVFMAVPATPLSSFR